MSYQESKLSFLCLSFGCRIRIELENSLVVLLKCRKKRNKPFAFSDRVKYCFDVFITFTETTHQRSTYTHGSISKKLGGICPSYFY